MSDPKDKMNKAQQLAELLGNGLNKEDFTQSFANVIAYVKRFEAAITRDFQNLHQTLTQKHDFTLQELRGKVDHVFVNDRVSKMEREHAQRMQEITGVLSKIEDKVQSVKDGKTPKKGVDYFDGKPGRNGSSDTPWDIRDKLGSLQGENRISIGHIHGLVEVLEDRNNKRIADLTAIGVLRHQLTYYDLSSQLNGSTTIFNLPAFQTVVLVVLSSYPNILRPGIDFSTTNSPSQITFLGTIATDMATVLSTGQTCILLLNQ